LIKSSIGDHELKANGSSIKYKGWLEILDDDSKSNEDDNKLPILTIKDQLELVAPGVKLEQKFTQPPARYSEQSLIKELEKKGIGKSSTIVTIMTKITDRDYVSRKKNTFFATPTGIQVSDFLQKHFEFMKYEYTAEMEEKLDLIAEGKYTYLEMMTSFYELFEKQLANAKGDTVKTTKFNCELCQRPMILKSSKYGSFLGCSGYNDKENKCNNIKNCEVNGEEIKIVEKKEYSVELVEGVSCPICSAGMVLKNGKFGQFYGCSKYKEGCKGISKVPSEKICPDCGKNLTVTTFKDGNKMLTCLGYPSCSHKENIPGETRKFFKKSWSKK